MSEKEKNDIIKEKKELSNRLIIVGLLFMLIGGMVIGGVIEAGYDFGRRKGRLLVIENLEPGTIYNKIENQDFCIIQNEGLVDYYRAYLLPNCPSRFTVVKIKGEYEIVPVLPISEKR